MKRSNNNLSNFFLLIDGERYTDNELVTSGGNPTSTVTINVELTAGQIVQVENDESTLIFGTNPDAIIHSWFTGFLLYAL